MSTPTPFWKLKPLDELSSEEWESLCDGCAQCCLHKLEDADTGEIYFTRVACEYVDNDSCGCSKYQERSQLVPDCLQVTPKLAQDAPWLPASCAYKLLANGQELHWWHPLVSGDRDTIHQAGVSIRDKFICETTVADDEFVDHIICEDDIVAVTVTDE